MEFLTNEKLTIVGAAGMIGSNMAQTAMMMKLTPNICLYDPFAPALEGVAEELYHCGFEGVNLTYTSDIKEALTGASYIVSSGGAARKAGMTREDLLKGNAEIAAQFGKDVRQYCPNVLNWTKTFQRDWTIDARFNYSYSRNKYVYVDEPDYPYIWQTRTGKPLSSTYGYVAEGLFRDEAEIKASPDQSLFGSTIMPGDIKYRDINGDGSITSEDQIMLSPYGNMPRIQYGFGLSMQWKNLDLSVFFNGSAKRTIMISGVSPFCANDSNDNNLMQWIADSHWSEGADNTGVLYPRLGTLTTQVTNNTQPSSFWMRNGNFLRFKTLELGYRFKWFRLYFSANNVAVWSKFKYWDPELSFNSYPLQRTFNIGLQFNL